MIKKEDRRRWVGGRRREIQKTCLYVGGSRHEREPLQKLGPQTAKEAPFASRTEEPNKCLLRGSSEVEELKEKRGQVESEALRGPCLALQYTLPPEPLMGPPVLPRPVQGHESHAVHRVWATGTCRHARRLAHHAQHDRGCHMLCHVHRSCHCPHPVPGLFPTSVPGEGQQGQEREGVVMERYWRLGNFT
jgi:hypothetical protein